MAKSVKPKTKKILFDNTATEIESGVWEWTVPPSVTGQRWRWSDNTGPNLNTGPVGSKGSWRPIVYCGEIKLAAVFSEGFAAARSAVMNILSGDATGHQKPVPLTKSDEED